MFTHPDDVYTYVHNSVESGEFDVIKGDLDMCIEGYNPAYSLKKYAEALLKEVMILKGTE